MSSGQETSWKHVDKIGICKLDMPLDTEQRSKKK